jgi:hypothetical protein
MVWSVVKARGRRGLPASLKALKRDIEQAWLDLDQEILNKLVMSFAHRLRILVAAQGRSTCRPTPAEYPSLTGRLMQIFIPSRLARTNSSWHLSSAWPTSSPASSIRWANSLTRPMVLQLHLE